MNTYGAVLALASFVVLSLPAQAFGPKRLKPEEKTKCEEIARTGLPDWKQPDLKLIPPPSNDLEKLPYKLPVVFNVINHWGAWQSNMDEKDIADDLIMMRRAFRPCGVEVVADRIRFIAAPSFLNSFDHDPDSDNNAKISEKQRCLLEPVHKPGLVNVYYVGSAPSNGTESSYTLNDYYYTWAAQDAGTDKFIGSSIVLDGDRFAGNARDIVTAHEVGHAAMNASHVFDNQHLNLMSDNRALLAPILTDEQCLKARSSRFVQVRDPSEAQAPTAPANARYGRQGH